MARRSTRSRTTNTADSNGGILGSGIFGLFGSVVNCDATDNSMYCSFMKFINVVLAIGMLCAILYIAFVFLYPYIKHVGR
jgi:hypothetical protein